MINTIQEWLLLQCNGDWEHGNGIKIDTLDNPGWSVKIDLTGTELEKIEAEKELKNLPNDWYNIQIKNKTFVASGDIKKLKLILGKFKKLVNDFYKNNCVVRNIYYPITYRNIQFWKPVKYRIININRLEILKDNYQYEKIDFKVSNQKDWEYWEDAIFQSKIKPKKTIQIKLHQLYDSVILIDNKINPTTGSS